MGRKLPEGWENFKINEIGNILFSDGNWIESKDQNLNGDINIIQVGNVGDGKILGENYRKLTLERANNLKCTFLKKGDILVSRMPDPLGRSSVFNLEDNKFVTVVDVSIIRTNYNPFLVSYIINSPSIRNKIQSLATGATRQRISRNNLGSINIPFPTSPTEQQKIVDYLDKQFGFIDKIEKEIYEYESKLDELEKGILEEAFSGIEGENIELEKIIDVRDGTHDSPKYVDKGYPLVTSKNLKHDYIDINNVKYITENDYQKINERSKVEKGDMLFAMIGTIGNPTIIDFEPNFAIKNVALFRNTSNKLEMKFLRYYLLSDKVIKKMKDDSSGGIQSFVSLGYLRKFPVPLPDLNTQKSIAYKLDKEFELINSTRQEIMKQKQNLKELRKAMLNDIFGGFEE